MNIIENLKWRYATKLFDKEKKISESDFEKLMEATRLSVSSYGLQLFKILVVKNPEVREKLREASYNQPQITDASHLLLFCNYSKYKVEHVDDYIKLRSKTLGVSEEEMSDFSGFLKSTLSSIDEKSYGIWTSKQTYIALSTTIAAASELKIDSCPMEGFEAEKYNEILGLKEKNLNASVIVALGYRSKEDKYQNYKKIRKEAEQLFEEI